MNINASAAVAAVGSNAARAGAVGFKVDASRGERLGRVSSEWFSRPDDERYLSLTELYQAVRGRAERAEARTVESRAIIAVPARWRMPGGWRKPCRSICLQPGGYRRQKIISVG
jgi:hypothetical protein